MEVVRDTITDITWFLPRPICRLNRDEHSQLYGLPFENELPVRSPYVLWPSTSSLGIFVSPFLSFCLFVPPWATTGHLTYCSRYIFRRALKRILRPARIKGEDARACAPATRVSRSFFLFEFFSFPPFFLARVIDVSYRRSDRKWSTSSFFFFANCALDWNQLEEIVWGNVKVTERIIHLVVESLSFYTCLYIGMCYCTYDYLNLVTFV